jgi:hypothetical protein
MTHHSNALLWLQPAAAAAAAAKLHPNHEAPATHINDRVPAASEEDTHTSRHTAHIARQYVLAIRTMGKQGNCIACVS